MAATTVSSLLAQVRVKLMEVTSLVTPTAPVITNQGTPASTSYSYKIVALNMYGHSIASAAGSTTTGAATLTTTNFNRITFTTVNGATAYEIWRTASAGTPSSTGLLATIDSSLSSYDDTGVAGDSATAPTTNTSSIPQPFWSDAELVDDMEKGAKDLWKAVLDLHEEHFLTVDTTNVTYAANDTDLTGVPSDVFRVYLIEPADTTSTGTRRGIVFTPRKYNDNDFIMARTRSVIDPQQVDEIFYCVTGLGTPNAAPVILCAPMISSSMTLRFVYNQTITLTASGSNPIPGESDLALISWTIAFARSKEREDRTPDAGWLAVYATEKQTLLQAMNPRQDQEPPVVEDFFGW